MANWKKTMMASAASGGAVPVQYMVYNQRGNASNRTIAAAHSMDTTNAAISYGIATAGSNTNAYYGGGYGIGDQKNNMGITNRIGGGSAQKNLTFYFYDMTNTALRGTRNVDSQAYDSLGIGVDNRLISGQVHKDRNEAIASYNGTGKVFSLNTYPGGHNYSNHCISVAGAKMANFNSYADTLTVGTYGGGTNYDRAFVYTPSGSSGALGSTNGSDGISGYTQTATITHNTNASYGITPGAAIEGTNYQVYYSKWNSSGSPSYYTNGIWCSIYDLSNPSSPSYTGYEFQSDAVDYYAIHGYSETNQEYFVISNRSTQSYLYMRRFDLSTISSPSASGTTLVGTSDYYTNTYSNYSEADSGFLLGTKPSNYNLRWYYKNAGGGYSYREFPGSDYWWDQSRIANWGGSGHSPNSGPRTKIGIF
jgi:hypothetical protein